MDHDRQFETKHPPTEGLQSIRCDNNKTDMFECDIGNCRHVSDNTILTHRYHNKNQPTPHDHHHHHHHWNNDRWRTRLLTEPRSIGLMAMHTAWPSSISKALEDAGCILVFWSQASVQSHRQELHREANTGLRSDKLVQVRKTNDDSKTVHVLTVTLNPNEVGSLSRRIEVQTDLTNGGKIEFEASAEVVP